MHSYSYCPGCWPDVVVGRATRRLRWASAVDALRFYQRRGFRLTAIRCGAVDQARRTLKPQIPLIGNDGIPIRDEIELAQELPLLPTIDGRSR